MPTLALSGSATPLLPSASPPRTRPAPSALDCLQTPEQARPAPPEQPSGPGEALRLVPVTPKPSKGRQRAAELHRLQFEGGVAHLVDPTPGKMLPYIEPAKVDDLAAQAHEVQLVTDVGDVWLVRELTGAERRELTFGQAATLATLVAAFPGAKIVDLHTPALDEREAIRGEAAGRATDPGRPKAEPPKGALDGRIAERSAERTPDPGRPKAEPPKGAENSLLPANETTTEDWKDDL